MGTQSQFALQQAVYETLAGDSALMAAVTGVFDRVPDGQAPPFLVLGDITAKEWANLSATGADIAMTLHVVSRAGGHKETIDLMDRAYALLHRGALTLDDCTLVMLRVTATGVHRSNDGLTTEGILQLRALVEDT